jgi:hypothetical protein
VRFETSGSHLAPRTLDISGECSQLIGVVARRANKRVSGRFFEERLQQLVLAVLSKKGNLPVSVFHGLAWKIISYGGLQRKADHVPSATGALVVLVFMVMVKKFCVGGFNVMRAHAKCDRISAVSIDQSDNRQLLRHPDGCQPFIKIIKNEGFFSFFEAACGWCSFTRSISDSLGGRAP